MLVNGWEQCLAWSQYSINVSSYCYHLTFSQSGTLPSPHGYWMSLPIVKLDGQEKEAVRVAWGKGAGHVSREQDGPSFPLSSSGGPFSPPTREGKMTRCPRFRWLKMKRYMYIYISSWPRNSCCFSPFCNEVFTFAWNLAYPRGGKRIWVRWGVLVPFFREFRTPAFILTMWARAVSCQLLFEETLDWVVTDVLTGGKAKVDGYGASPTLINIYLLSG